MKKLSMFFLILAATATFAGCSQQTVSVSIFGGSYFLSDYTNLSVGNINETTTYSLTFSPAENAPVTFALENGSYKTHVYVSEYDGKKCYRVDTELYVKGKYVIDSVETPVDDVITTTAYVCGIEDSLRPLRSERNVKAHSLRFEDKKYEIDYYEYSLSTVYGDSDAIVTFTPNETASTGKYSLEAGETEYKKVFAKTYFDNETILFAIRALKLSTGFSTTFSSIDALSKANRTLKLAAAGSSSATSSANTEAYNTLNVSYTNNGEKITSVNVFKLNLAVNGTYSGSNQVLYYSDPSNEKQGQRLIKMETSFMYNVGTLTYSISSVTG